MKKLRKNWGMLALAFAVTLVAAIITGTWLGVIYFAGGVVLGVVVAEIASRIFDWHFYRKLKRGDYDND